MSGPLPKRLPIDEDNVPDPDEEDHPPKPSAKENMPVIPEPAPMKKNAPKSRFPHFDDAEVIEEPVPARRVVPLFARKNTVAAPVKRARVPEPEENFHEIDGEYEEGDEDGEGDEVEAEEEAEEDLLPPPPPKRRLRTVMPDPEESAEVPGREQIHHATHGAYRRNVRTVPAAETHVSMHTRLVQPRRQASPAKAVAHAPRRVAKRRSVLGELEQLAAESPDDAEV